MTDTTPGVDQVTMQCEAAADLKSIIEAVSNTKHADGRDSVEIVVQLRIDPKSRILQRVYPIMHCGKFQRLQVKTQEGLMTFGEKMDADEAARNHELFGGRSRYTGAIEMSKAPSEN